VNNFYFWVTSPRLIKTFFILYHTKLFIFGGGSPISPRLLSPSPCPLSMVIILCDEMHLFPPQMSALCHFTTHHARRSSWYGEPSNNY